MEMATEKQVNYIKDLFQRNGIKQSWIDHESLKSRSCFEADMIIKVIRLLDKIRSLKAKSVSEIIDSHNANVNIGGVQL